MAWIRTDIHRSRQNGPAGYGPADLQSAYNLTHYSVGDGAGQIVALVDAFDDPTAESDLGVYRSTFGLSACTTANGCFLKVNESGATSPLPNVDPTGNWEGEESLDLDMVSAICPNCKILLVEANSSSQGDLYGSVDAAANCGVDVISNSWGGNEYPTEVNEEAHFNHPGIMITVAAGDFGYNGPNTGYPAASQYVTSVGGTSLTMVGGNRESETVWAGSGSLCSLYISQPVWQTDLGSQYSSVCSRRIDNDVAAVADPNTGVAVYDTFNGGAWGVLGGTSASAPIVGAIYALAGQGSQLIYGSTPYAHPSSLFDIVSGSNGLCFGTFLCNAEAGFDGPTGVGSPNGLGAFGGPAPSPSPSPSPTPPPSPSPGPSPTPTPTPTTGPLSLSPTTLYLVVPSGSPQAFGAYESNYGGLISAVSTNPGVATVSPSQGSGYPVTFTVTPVSSGYTTITVTDDHGGSQSESVYVTTAVTINEYPVPTRSSGPFAITSGPDGNIWFTEDLTSKIGRVTTSGIFTEFSLPTINSSPDGITSGPDGNLWFTELFGNHAGSITTTGQIIEYPVAAPSRPYFITTGPDGNLWFSDENNVDSMTTAGVVTKYFVGSNAFNTGIAVGPDGNIWFTDTPENKIGRMTTLGAVTLYSLTSGEPYGIAAGPDGNLWFAEADSVSKIGKITTSGVITEYSLPSPNMETIDIVAGPDGNLWFTEPGGQGQIGRVTTAGVVTEFAVPTFGSVPLEIASGPDGNIWFTENNFDVSNIGQLLISTIGQNRPRHHTNRHGAARSRVMLPGMSH